jgi:hypothetical protein
MQLASVEYLDRPEHFAFHSPERQLWCAVIGRALQDALDNAEANSEMAQRERIRSEARSWFVQNGEDFQAACNAAGIEPSLLRQRVMRMMSGAGLSF